MTLALFSVMVSVGLLNPAFTDNPAAIGPNAESPPMLRETYHQTPLHSAEGGVPATDAIDTGIARGG